MLKEKVCHECLRKFETEARSAKYCPECRKVVEKRQEKEKRARQKIINAMKARQVNSKSLTELQLEIKEFNEATGKNLSYGQYVAYKAGLLKV